MASVVPPASRSSSTLRVNPAQLPPPHPLGRGVYCNRTLNMRTLKAIGYDMDYTLVHYDVEVWERRAWEYMQHKFSTAGWPVDELRFDPNIITRGLIIDTQLGNIVKANRFGFVKKAMHGTRVLEFAEHRAAYARTVVDLSDSRWLFLNTLFSLSEGCMYAQLVDLLDAGKLSGPMGYRELYQQIRVSMDKTHMEGALKAEIMANPAKFVVQDEGTTLALLDQKHAGKTLMLITNSEWYYTHAMMTFAIDPFLPAGTTWRDLFDVVIAGARKPEFFTGTAPFFEVATDDGLLRANVGEVQKKKAYLGGSAVALERALGFSGDEILYVGDHMFGDVHVSNRVLRWRTALVLRELEDEVLALEQFAATEEILARRMKEKEALEDQLSQVKLWAQRKRHHYGPGGDDRPLADLDREAVELRSRLVALDTEIGPMAKTAAEVFNPTWGPLTRAGNDKSHLARQIERYADVYTSRVSNFLFTTPFIYMRSPRGSLPHDPIMPGGPPLALT